jgi:hypothetical protein
LGNSLHDEEFDLAMGFGGIPRKYAQVAAVPILQGLEELKELCEKGELKVPVDSCWSLENALKVSELRLK